MHAPSIHYHQPVALNQDWVIAAGQLDIRTRTSTLPPEFGGERVVLPVRGAPHPTCASAFACPGIPTQVQLTPLHPHIPSASHICLPTRLCIMMLRFFFAFA